MLDFLLSLDESLFLAIYNLPHNRLFDNISMILSAGDRVIISWLLWLLLAFAFVFYERKWSKVLFLSLLLAGIFTLLVNEVGLKSVFTRSRPQLINQKLESDNFQIVNLYGSDSPFSFPSSHATQAFAAAYILAKRRKKFAFLFYFLAVFVSFARIYLGRHYPSDVTAGALLGIFIGWLSLRMSIYLLKE